MKQQQHHWTSSRVLVTGATGVVGSNLVRRLLDEGAFIVCFVRDHDPASALWYSGDIEHVSVCTGRLEVFEHVKCAIVEREIDTVFHLGAQAIIGAGHRDPLGTFETNIRGTYHILEACRLYGDRIKRIVVASSDKAYGECEALPYTEFTPLAANNPYDVSKSCADLIAQSYAVSFGLPIAIARCGNIFGPGDLHWNRLVPGTIRSLLHGERPVIRSNGQLVRDYLYVNDAVDAYLALAAWSESAHDAANCAFNFSSNQPLSVLEMTKRIQKACGREDLEPRILDGARGEIQAQHLDSSKAHRELRWKARTDLQTSLGETVGWYRRYFDRYAIDAMKNPLPMPRPQRARASA